jgi:zinc-ribbon domain
MKFCTACGKPLREGTRFCIRCGAPVHKPAPAQPAVTESAATQPAATASPYGSAGHGHTEAVSPPYQQGAEETVAGPAYPDAEFDDAGTQNLPLDLGDSGPRTGTPEPSWSSPAAPPRMPRFPGSGRRMLVLGAVVVAVLAAGSATLVWATSRHPRPAGALQHGVSARPTEGTRSPSASPAPSSPSPSPSASPPSPGATSHVLQVAPGVAANPAASQVEALVTSYFAAINAHNYQNYVSLLTPSTAQNLTQAQFNSGYRSTTDSNMTLTSISSTSPGSVAATITFTSQQLPADSPDNSPCDKWNITLFLQPDGSSYLIGGPPATYHASYAPCQ